MPKHAADSDFFVVTRVRRCCELRQTLLLHPTPPCFVAELISPSTGFGQLETAGVLRDDSGSGLTYYAAGATLANIQPLHGVDEGALAEVCRNILGKLRERRSHHE